MRQVLCRRRRRLHLIITLAATAGLRPGQARADIDEEHPVHHFFNARLLEQGENQISVATNYNVGVTGDLQLGANAAIFLMGAPNLSVKHQMFRGEDYQTSFAGHAFYLDIDASQGLDTDSGGTPGEEAENDGGSGRSRALFFPFGIVNTYDLNPRTFVNVGLYDYFFYQKDSQYDATSVMHVLTPSLGIDVTVHRNFGLTALTAYPAFMYMELNSDVAEISGFLDFTKLPPEYSPSISFLTATWSTGVFNAEFGKVFLGGIPMTYINLFWRWHV